LPQTSTLGFDNTAASVPSNRRSAVELGNAGVPPAGVIGQQQDTGGILGGHSEVTGSVTRSPASPAPTRMQPTAAIPPASPAPASTSADKLPPGLGSQPLRLAAASGEPAAEYEIAVRYAEGKGVPADLEQAARWFERAAKAGLAPAQFRLGSLYEKGQGVTKDVSAARRLYTAAAQKGNAKAMHNLAVLHAEGVEGKPDYKVAAQWFRSAALRGIADSQYNLGILYARGIGVEQNLAESYKWFVLAAGNGDQDAARKRDDVAARLDQQSLVAAKLAAQTFVPEPQPEEAINVKAPPGGWDRTGTAVPAAKPNPRG
jgi:localization factor PodJL